MDTGLITITPESQELIAFAHTFLATAEAIRITSPEEAQAAVDQTRQIKECAKTVEEVRKSFTTPLDEQKKAYMDLFRPASDVLVRAEALLKSAITTFNQEQERIAAREAEERRRQEQIERDRQAEEQKQAAALLAKSEEAAANGDFAAAEALEQQAAAVQEVAAPIAVPATLAPEKPKGAAFKKVWKCRVVDAALVPDQFKTINEKALDAYAKSMKQDAKVPGCEFYTEDQVAIR